MMSGIKDYTLLINDVNYSVVKLISIAKNVYLFYHPVMIPQSGYRFTVKENDKLSENMLKKRDRK
ncbi:hypothetical protein [Providencia sp.]